MAAERQSQACVVGDDVIAFAGGHMAGYKKPKTVDFVEEIPKTTYGKPDKKAVRAPYWTGETRMVR